MRLNVFPTHPSSPLLTQGRKGDPGWDLYVMGDHKINPFCWSAVYTGVRFQIPEGHYLRIDNRNSIVYNKGLFIVPTVLCPGVTSEIRVMAFNLTGRQIRLPHGTPIAQVLMHQFIPIEPVLVPELPGMEDGDAVRGFKGSIVSPKGPVLDDFARRIQEMREAHKRLKQELREKKKK